MTELLVKDKFGKARDVILGYDDNSQLLKDPGHPVFNAIVGRYANRIKKGTFTIPISKDFRPDDPQMKVYHIPTNDGDGAATLHGGITGWDRRNWTIVSKTNTSVTYRYLDAGDEGFPGNVTALVTYTVENGGVFKTSIRASATEKTPIMLTHHIYWNLDAFQGSEDILGHQLQLDASKVIDTDERALPTGRFNDVEGTVLDFRMGKTLSSDWSKTANLFGNGSQGYNHCWVFDQSKPERPRSPKPCITLSSETSGIRLEISTNNPAVQVYTSYYLDAPRKGVHGGPSRNYTSQSAIAIEQQGLVDAINHPEWGIDQIYGPDRDYEWNSTYKFSAMA